MPAQQLLQLTNQSLFHLKFRQARILTILDPRLILASELTSLSIANPPTNHTFLCQWTDSQLCPMIETKGFFQTGMLIVAPNDAVSQNSRARKTGLNVFPLTVLVSSP